MNKTRRTLIAITTALTIALPTVASSAEVQKAEMAGYLLVSTDKVPDTYNAGFSLYAAAWPLLQQYPGRRFQTGLFFRSTKGGFPRALRHAHGSRQLF